MIFAPHKNAINFAPIFIWRCLTAQVVVSPKIWLNPTSEESETIRLVYNDCHTSRIAPTNVYHHPPPAKVNSQKEHEHESSGAAQLSMGELSTKYGRKLLLTFRQFMLSFVNWAFISFCHQTRTPGLTASRRLCAVSAIVCYRHAAFAKVRAAHVRRLAK